MNSSGLGLEMSGGAPKPPTFLNPRRSGVGAPRPSRDSGLDNETQLRLSEASHLFRAAVCTFRCTSRALYDG
ncbi:uncharacterized [Tachysurus ichikawai]